MNPSCSISVIVPVYNPGCHFAACLDSMLAQTVQDWELILVDDGSPDGSGAVCDEYAAKDPRIRVIHTPNRGPGAARNTGMDAARGPWLCFMDADDTADPDYLETLLGTDPVPGDLVVTGMTDEFPGKASRVRYAFPSRATAADITLLPPDTRILEIGYPVAKLFDAGLIHSSGLRMETRIRLHEDHIFFLQYLRLCRRILLVPGTPYHYWHHPDEGSLTRASKPVEEILEEARMLTAEMLETAAHFPGYPEKALCEAISLYGLADYIKALRRASTREEYRKAAQEVYENRQLFFSRFHPRKGILHKWMDLMRAFRTARKTKS